MRRPIEHAASGIAGAVVGAIALAWVSDWLARDTPELTDREIEEEMLREPFERARFRRAQRKCDPGYAEALRSNGARIELRSKTRGVDVFLPPDHWSTLDDRARWILARYFSICTFADGPASVVIRQGETGRELARYTVGEGYRRAQ